MVIFVTGWGITFLKMSLSFCITFQVLPIVGKRLWMRKKRKNNKWDRRKCQRSKREAKNIGSWSEWEVALLHWKIKKNFPVPSTCSVVRWHTYNCLNTWLTEKLPSFFPIFASYFSDIHVALCMITSHFRIFILLIFLSLFLAFLLFSPFLSFF